MTCIVLPIDRGHYDPLIVYILLLLLVDHVLIIEGLITMRIMLLGVYL